MTCVSRRLPVLFLVYAILSCTDPASRWEVGGLYSVSDGGEFRVVKILALDPEAVSIRLYRNTFPSRPTSVVPDSLSLGGIDDPQGFGVGHIPLSPRDFALSFPVHLATVPVTDDELDGYREWKESGGGVFSFEASKETAPPQNAAEE